MRDPASESKLGSGGLLGSDAARRSAGSESKLGQTGFARAGFARAGEEILEQFQQQLHQQNSARGDRIGKVTVDNDDGTYTVVESGGGITHTRVPAQPGVLIFTDGWYCLQEAGPGLVIAGAAPLQGGTA